MRIDLHQFQENIEDSVIAKAIKNKIEVTSDKHSSKRIQNCNIYIYNYYITTTTCKRNSINETSIKVEVLHPVIDRYI